jgi:hypothetical protein
LRSPSGKIVPRGTPIVSLILPLVVYLV